MKTLELQKSPSHFEVREPLLPIQQKSASASHWLLSSDFFFSGSGFCFCFFGLLILRGEKTPREAM